MSVVRRLQLLNKLKTDLGTIATTTLDRKHIQQVGERDVILFEADNENYVFGTSGTLDSELSINLFCYTEGSNNHENVQDALETLKDSIYDKLTNDIVFDWNCELSNINTIDTIVIDLLGILVLDAEFLINRSDDYVT